MEQNTIIAIVAVVVLLLIFYYYHNVMYKMENILAAIEKFDKETNKNTACIQGLKAYLKESEPWKTNVKTSEWDALTTDEKWKEFYVKNVSAAQMNDYLKYAKTKNIKCPEAHMRLY
jgi:hypothetical protein